MKPNIVFIITDNQSPWTMGCYGNNEILTPNLDKLASEGIRFNNAFCNNPVCSPNRATLLTGLMPSQHGVHCYLATEEPDAQMGPEAYCTIKEFKNLPSVLSENGYKCGMTGKWHLGDSMNPQLGFKYWFAKPKGHTSSFYNTEAIWEGNVYTEENYFPEVITDHAVDFIAQQNLGEPFFLYVGYPSPYGLDQDMRKEHKNRHLEYYSDKSMTSFPREEMNPWLKQNTDCIDNITCMRNYATAVSGVDDCVGRIIDKLENKVFLDNTIIVFTADHGLCAGHNGCWGMGDHTRPLAMYQTNLRVPLLISGPGIVSGNVSEQVTHCDFLPSLLSFLDLDQKVPEWTGEDYSCVFSGQTFDRKSDFVFHEFENARCIQNTEWKYIKRNPDGPNELYHIQVDPKEKRNLIDDDSASEIKESLEAELESFFSANADPEFDLWKNGWSKAGRLI